MVLVLAPPAAHAEAIWVIDTLDGAVHVDQLSLAIDSLDRLHVSYHDINTGQLLYGSWVSGVWATELVASPAGGSSIAVSGETDPSISYLASGALRFARRTTEGWTSEVADSANHIEGSPSLALRSSGQPDIAYLEGYPWFGQHYRHATRTETGWSTEQLSLGSVDPDADAVVGSDDLPRIAYAAYYSSYRTKLVVAALDGAVWARATADSGVGCFGISHAGIHMELDAENCPHLAYRYVCADIDAGTSSVRYTEKTTSGAWIDDYVDWVWQDPMSGENNWLKMGDFVLAPDGTPWLVYVKGIDNPDVQAESLLVARRIGGAWMKECLLPADVRGASLVVDSEGTLFILFSLPAPQNGLYLARRVEATGIAGEPRPVSTLRLAVAPNPMRAGGTIMFALDGGGTVDLGAGGQAMAGATRVMPAGARASLLVYDIRGRVVRSFDTIAPFGALSWDGADASGRPLAPGVYFVRLHDGERSAAARVTIVR